MESDDRRLKDLAKRFAWIKRIYAPDAPGFAFFGAQVLAADFGRDAAHPGQVNVSGKGFTAQQAFSSCVGEGVEYLSQLESGSEDLVRGDPAAVDHGHNTGTEAALMELIGAGPGDPLQALEWMPARRLSDGSEVLVPADLCITRAPVRRQGEAPRVLSTGCAAGPTREDAVLYALLEVVERDAAALWWSGGSRARPVALEDMGRWKIAAQLAGLRADTGTRFTWLLDITSDTDIPCVAAVSVNKAGRGFASGLAARPTLGEAARDALLELCQIELGHHLVAAKRAVRGDAALNDADRRQLRRSERLNPSECRQLHPVGAPRVYRKWPARCVAESIEELTGRLRGMNVESLVVDLTRADLGLHAVRALAPGLQPFPSKITTTRLKRIIGQRGAESAQHVDEPLF
jgi:ribosomal protein S12 methylthiotransferase accessory factor